MKAVWIKDGIVTNVSGWDENSSTEVDGYLIVVLPDDVRVSKGFVLKEQINSEGEVLRTFEDPSLPSILG